MNKLSNDDFYDFVVHRDLFNVYNKAFYENKIPKTVQVIWSPNKLYKRVHGHFLPDEDILNLSQHLRGGMNREQLLVVFLHEMVHAYLVHTVPKYQSGQLDAHGDEFTLAALRVGCAAGAQIPNLADNSVKVRLPKNVWRCDSVLCQKLEEEFGYWRNDKYQKPIEFCEVEEIQKQVNEEETEEKTIKSNHADENCKGIFIKQTVSPEETERADDSMYFKISYAVDCGMYVADCMNRCLNDPIADLYTADDKKIQVKNEGSDEEFSDDSD